MGGKGRGQGRGRGLAAGLVTGQRHGGAPGVAGRIAAELDAAVAFWERHSHDPEHGGFFSCLSRDGSVYDDTKFVWLQGRQIWVYSRLYRTVPLFRRPQLLEAARKGGEGSGGGILGQFRPFSIPKFPIFPQWARPKFLPPPIPPKFTQNPPKFARNRRVFPQTAAGEFLESHVRPEPGSSRAAFALRRDGRPERLQRSFYSEAFCALGLDELGRAAGEERYRVGPLPKLPGTPPQITLGPGGTPPQITRDPSPKNNLGPLPKLPWGRLRPLPKLPGTPPQITRDRLRPLPKLPGTPPQKITWDPSPNYPGAGAWARRWAGAVWGWARGAPMELGRPRFSGTPPQQALAQALMVLKVGLQLWGDPRRDPQNQPDPEAEAMAEWGARHVLMHLQRGDSVVLENVSPEGEELPGSLGRLMNPGHALEAAWLLLEFSGRRGDADLGARAVAALVEGPLKWGWDPQHGGLFYFLDADGHCPTQLEWALKLWWPHAEAMVALLAAQRFQPRPSLVSQFLRLAQYTFDKFRDPEHGEWFGYLNRDGSVALSIKGGPYKGCFHVARALLMCEEMLDDILEGEKPPQ
ncbi:N-acylglucosamine 2-epimerase [Lonchura striata]